MTMITHTIMPMVIRMITGTTTATATTMATATAMRTIIITTPIRMPTIRMGRARWKRRRAEP
jgi:hypothetical protein